MKLLLFVLICVCFVRKSNGLPGGAPTGACSTFTPRHVDRTNGGFISTQSPSSNPYTVKMSRRNFTSNTVIQVWVEDDRDGDQNGYRGILLQARKNGNFDAGPVGTWQNAPNFTRMLRCCGNNNNDAMTHSEVTMIKNSETIFEWKAPCKKDVGDIVFMATIAQSREMFWTRLSSMVVTDLEEEEGSGGEEDEDVCEEESIGCSDAPTIRPMLFVFIVQTVVTFVARFVL